MRRIPLPIFVLLILFTLPVSVPIAIFLSKRDRRRMQAAALNARCVECGATLGLAALDRADKEWADHVAALQRDQPTMRFRLVRRVLARCSNCGAEYGFDARTRTFSRVEASGATKQPDKADSESRIVDLDDRVWLPGAQPVQDFVCDVSFAIRTKLTTLRGPDADGRMESILLAEVPPPALPSRAPGIVITADILGHMDELVAHYRRIVAAAEQAGLARHLQHPLHYFRVQPVILAGEELTEFAWYDSVLEAKKVLRAIVECNLEAEEPDEILDDLEQCWRGRLAVWRGRIGLVEWDWDHASLPPTPGYSFDGEELVKQAQAALQRLDVVHGELVRALGHDYWNHR
jgi:hypothetical protein